MISQARIIANKLNAQKSTGPRTAEGKETSRGNALRHGLSGGYVVVARALGGILKTAVEELRKDTQPRNLEEESLLEQIAVDCFRIEFCQAASLTLLVRSWDEGDNAQAVRLARQLSTDLLLASLVEATMPRRAAHLLESCDGLVDAANEGRPWTNDEKALAFDLVGALRAERVSVPALTNGDRTDQDVDDWGRLVDALERFLKAREVRERWNRLLGLPRDFLPTAQAIERYEAGAEGRIRRTLRHWQETRWRVDPVQGSRPIERRLRSMKLMTAASC
jgi:hypothetical protein